MDAVEKKRRLSPEQMRAQDAWDKARGQPREYKILAKGLPALIMNSGLIQVLAFLEEKGKKTNNHHGVLGRHMRQWLVKMFPGQLKGEEFEAFMDALIQTRPQEFREITAEAQAWLRWVRQMAAAVITD